MPSHEKVTYRENVDANLIVVQHGGVIVSRHGQCPHVRRIGGFSRRDGNGLSGLHRGLGRRDTCRCWGGSTGIDDGTACYREINGGRVAKGRTSSVARLVDAAVGSHESFVGSVEDGEVVGCHFADSVEGIVQVGVGIGVGTGV